METPIFLAVLAAVVLALLYQIYREQRKDAAPKREAAALQIVEVPVAVTIAPSPIEPKVEEPASLSLPSPVLPPVVVKIAAAERPHPQVARKPKPVVVATEASQTAVSTVTKVLGMLKQRDSLAAAFLLREIFDPPVSRRRRRR